jgi:uncharacterized phiE125 gp8 family phage protein
MDCIGFKVYAEPIVEPVTLAEMRKYAARDSSDTTWDDFFSLHISAARIEIERVTGRIFCSSTYDVQFKSFSDTELKLPVTPVQSVTSIVYKISNVAYTLAANQYELRSYKTFPLIVPAWDVSWPAVDEESVVVRVLAGNASTYDKMGCALIKAMVADVFEHRESQSEISLTRNQGVERIYNAYHTR